MEIRQSFFCLSNSKYRITRLLKKKFEKTLKKIWKVTKKGLIFASAFALKTSEAKTRKKEFFKILKWTKRSERESRSTRVEIHETHDPARIKISVNNFYHEEFDPGSGWTLATGLTHASRGAAGSSNTSPATGARVSNTCATNPVPGDNPRKRGLTSHNILEPHGFGFKIPVVRDGHARH